MSAALIAFLAWSLLAVGFGLFLGKVIAYADAAEEQEPRRVGTDTEVIDFRNAPQSWLA